MAQCARTMGKGGRRRLSALDGRAGVWEFRAGQGHGETAWIECVGLRPLWSRFEQPFGCAITASARRRATSSGSALHCVPREAQPPRAGRTRGRTVPYASRRRPEALGEHPKPGPERARFPLQNGDRVPATEIAGVVRARRPERLPVVPSVEEVKALLRNLEGSHWLAACHTVQEQLGHKDVRTTQIYTHVIQRGGLAVLSPLGAVLTAPC